MEPLEPRREPSERVTELIARLDKLAQGHAKFCEVCADVGWRWHPETLWLADVEMLVYYCPTCGHVRFHAIPGDLAPDVAT